LTDLAAAEEAVRALEGQVRARDERVAALESGGREKDARTAEVERQLAHWQVIRGNGSVLGSR
jgi:hypothetical protein